MSEIKITNEGKGIKGRYVTVVDGHAAELTYTWLGPGRMSLDHAGVPEAIGGRGIASALVAHAVEDARARGFKLVARCPFAVAQFKQHPEWADVTAERRAKEGG